MQRLSRADLEAIVGLTAELAAATLERDRVDRWFLERVCKLLDGEMAAYSTFDATGALLEDCHYPREPFVPSEAEWELFRTQNPFTQYAALVGTPFIPAQRISDVVDMRAFRKTELWELVHGDEMPHAIQMRFPGARKTKLVLEVDRSGRNFSSRDVLVVEMLRPSLIAYEAYRGLAWMGAGPHDASPNALSPRENEVLDSVAQGASNAQIAERLWISPGTVKKHLDNIYVKLEVTSRTEALARTGRSSGAADAPWLDMEDRPLRSEPASARPLGEESG